MSFKGIIATLSVETKQALQDAIDDLLNEDVDGAIHRLAVVAEDVSRSIREIMEPGVKA